MTIIVYILKLLGTVNGVSREKFIDLNNHIRK